MLRITGISISFFCFSLHVLAQTKVITSLGLNELRALCTGEKDKIIIINFWASWCKPCMEELPYFRQLQQEIPAARVVLINLDFKEDVEKKVIPLLFKGGYDGCEVNRVDGLSADDWMPLVDPAWSGTLPGTLILAGGKKKFVEQKFENYNALKTTILQL